eukprot:862853-Amphidinium_carterae.1
MTQNKAQKGSWTPKRPFFESHSIFLGVWGVLGSRGFVRGVCGLRGFGRDATQWHDAFSTLTNLRPIPRSATSFAACSRAVKQPGPPHEHRYNAAETGCRPQSSNQVMQWRAKTTSNRNEHMDKYQQKLNNSETLGNKVF